MGDQRFLSAAENGAHELVEPAAVCRSALLSLCSAHISNLLAASTDSSVLPEHQLVRLEQALTMDALDLRLRESRSSLFAIGSSRARRPVRLEGRFLIVGAVEPDPKTGDTKIHPHADELNLKRNGIARLGSGRCLRQLYRSTPPHRRDGAGDSPWGKPTSAVPSSGRDPDKCRTLAARHRPRGSEHARLKAVTLLGNAGRS